MSKPKNTTLLKRFGFQDEDLKTPEHDEMFLTLLDTGNLFKVIKGTGCLDNLCTQCTCNECASKTCSWNWKTKDCLEEECEVVKEEYKKYMVMPYEDGGESWLTGYMEVEPEYVIKNKYNNFIVGFVDVYAKLPLIATDYFRLVRKNWDNKVVPYTRDYFIEIKPKIRSVGETIRQINMYRAFVEGGQFIVVTKNPQHTSAYRSAGIHIYDYNKLGDGGCD